MRVTKKVLEELTEELNRKEGRPIAYYGPDREEDGQLKRNPGHIHLDHASCYGGYALREVSEGGGESFYYPSWTRVSGREMYQYLLGKLSS